MTAALWTFEELADAAKGKFTAPAQGEITGLSIDTRTLKNGEAFVALKGDRFDGHDFVAAAFKAGASFAIVREDKLSSLPQGNYLIVDDVEEAVRRLARVRRAQSKAKIVAVTGSVGKTGTKEMLRLALSKSGVTHASVASFNNHWGVPLSLARMPRDAEFAIFEIGMNHSGEITPLVAMVKPHVAIVTTVAAVHLEFFKNVEEIAEAKAEIFSGLEKGGVALINIDNDYAPILLKRAEEHGAKIVRFGEKPEAEARLLQAVLKPSQSHLAASIFGTEIAYKVGVPGRHIAQNSLAVLAACSLMGADLALAALSLADIKANRGRGARIELELGDAGSFLLIDESYNANPTSMRAALALLGDAKPNHGGRRIAVLGDMLELGEQGAPLHAGLSDAVLGAKVDRAYLVGPLMGTLWQSLPIDLRGAYAHQSAEIEQPLIEAIRPGDVVMVKGSLGSKMGPVVESLIARFGKPA
ncbi:MAG: UDP-N-acetylmuramoylalanyl-D-glutamyl-2,6-diaminopimelate--D-alanyl-D-alanine ligase [Pseudomonadota bacterium]